MDLSAPEAATAMNERINACLDGDLPMDDLLPSERLELTELDAVLSRLTADLGSRPTPDLRHAVISRLPALSQSGSPGWRRAIDWLWRPRPIQLRLRPAYALASLAVIVGAGAAAKEFDATPAPEALAIESPAEASHVYVQFRLESPSASRVALAGTFTGWEPEYTLRESEPGVWTVLVPLAPGVHDYAFVVDGSEWVADPAAPQVADSFGGTNSRISLPPMGAA